MYSIIFFKQTVSVKNNCRDSNTYTVQYTYTVVTVQ